MGNIADEMLQEYLGHRRGASIRLRGILYLIENMWSFRAPDRGSVNPSPWNMAFCVCDAITVMPKTWWPSVVNVAVFAPVAERGA